MNFDKISELKGRCSHIEHLLIICCEFLSGEEVKGWKSRPFLNEVVVWWEDYNKSCNEAKTKELNQLANGIWECYEKDTEKYIDPADVKRIVELARTARI